MHFFYTEYPKGYWHMKPPARSTASCCAAKPPGSEETHCPVEATITLIGGKYKSLILWNLTRGMLRFSQLRKVVAILAVTQGGSPGHAENADPAIAGVGA